MSEESTPVAKIRVLFIDPAGELWGSERCLLLILAKLDNTRYETAVCLPRRTPLAAELQTRGIRYFPWFQGCLHKRGPWARLEAALGLCMAVLAFRPDIIHLNQAGGVRIAFLVARLLRRCLVIHVRMEMDVSLVARRVTSWHKIKCIAISRLVANGLCAAGVPPTQVAHITDPIDISKPRSNLTPERQWQLGFVGRLCKEKGIELFLKASELVVKVRPGTRAVVVGSSGAKTLDGQNYLEAMQVLAARLGIAAKVDFLGFRKDVPELMRQMTVFAMVSEVEAWGRVVAEAMTAGAVVVATNTGGPSEIITNGVNGLLVPPGDVEAMAQAILRLLDDRQMATRLAAEGREWVARECDPGKHAVRVMQVYESLLN